MRPPDSWHRLTKRRPICWQEALDFLFVPAASCSALAPGTAALSRQIFSDELCFVGSQVRTSKSVGELVRESLITRSALMLLLGRKPLTSFEMDAPAMLPNIIQTSLRPSCHFPRSPRRARTKMRGRCRCPARHSGIDSPFHVSSCGSIGTVDSHCHLEVVVWVTGVDERQ